MQFGIIAAMFVSASYIVNNFKDVSPFDSMLALFCIMFGASNAGTAAAFGPDMGKATIALKRIFEFIRYPSTINALEMDEKEEGKILDINTV